jgi:hypothetical protein
LAKSAGPSQIAVPRFSVLACFLGGLRNTQPMAVKQAANLIPRHFGETVRIIDCHGIPPLPEGLPDRAIGFVLGSELEHLVVFHGGREFKVAVPCVRDWDT